MVWDFYFNGYLGITFCFYIILMRLTQLTSFRSVCLVIPQREQLQVLLFSALGPRERSLLLSFLGGLPRGGDKSTRSAKLSYSHHLSCWPEEVVNAGLIWHAEIDVSVLCSPYFSQMTGWYETIDVYWPMLFVYHCNAVPSRKPVTVSIVTAESWENMSLVMQYHKKDYRGVPKADHVMLVPFMKRTDDW